MHQSIEQFATASVSPRSVAWLIRPEEPDRLETIINYNCAMLGGWFNVLIPVSGEGLTAEYQQFLVDYDPDLIVLAPGDTESQIASLPRDVYPYACVPWESVSQIATLSPMGYSSGQNVPPPLPLSIRSKRELSVSWKVAIANPANPDANLLALITCGDVALEEPVFEVFDGFENIDATGYREILLAPLADPEKRASIAARIENDQLKPGATREELTDIISSEHAFPLLNALDMLETCDRWQAYPDSYQSIIGLTTQYREGRSAQISLQSRDGPALVILVSEGFRFEQAVLFWNLRARGVRVVWLAFSALELQSTSVCRWVESDFGGSSFSLLIRGDGIAFSCPNDEIARLERAVEKLSEARTGSYPEWRVLSHEQLIVYHAARPVVSREHIAVAQEGTRCGIVPKLEPNSMGTLGMSIEWSELMIPRSKSLVEELVSSERITGFVPGLRHPSVMQIGMLRFRVTKDRNVRLQFQGDTPIYFNKPIATGVFEVLFRSAGVRIERSATARYHKVFVERALSLEDAAQYLSAAPYRRLLEALSNNSDKSKPGWILEHPDKRRALHHLHLREVLGESTPEDTREYFNSVCDELPAEATRLLERQLLERGFLMKCDTCSFNSWYPIQNVGTRFECQRCFQSQIYGVNPTWLYKLPEVVFQGFADNMQVPLLALNYLSRTSRKSFDWIPDSNIYFTDNRTERQRNVDILCLRDGKTYVGEAKSSDRIDSDQIDLMAQLAERVGLDGLVFATSSDKWDRSTSDKIRALATRSTCEVIILTSRELYGP
jgi:hypothetical protein